MIGLPGQDIFVPLEVNAPFVEREVIEIIADSLSKAGWSRRCVAAFESPRGRSRWIADAHRGDGERFVVQADEKLTAFPELELAIRNLSPEFAVILS